MKLSLSNAEEVRAAFREIQSSVATKNGPGHFQGVTVQRMATIEGYELLIRALINSSVQCWSFGMGGQLVKVFEDRAIGLPPLNTTLARRLMGQTRIYKALKGVRGRKPVDLARLEQLLVRFSQMVLEQSWISEIDINPLSRRPTGCSPSTPALCCIRPRMREKSSSLRYDRTLRNMSVKPCWQTEPH